MFRIKIRLLQDGQFLPVEELVNDQATGGLILAGETSAWPRALRFGLSGRGAFQQQLERERELSGLPKNQHRFVLSVDAAGMLVFDSTQPARLPMGSYVLRLKIADLEIQDSEMFFTVEQQQLETTINIRVRKDNRRISFTRPLDNFDPVMAEVLQNRCSFDGLNGMDWLNSDRPRIQRKACLLNILAKMRAIQTTIPNHSLLSFVENVFFANVDRLYAQIDIDFFREVQNLADAQAFTRDKLVVPIHERIKERIPNSEAQSYLLHSFRQLDAPSLQAVLAIPPDIPGLRVYADIDIDLGNPFQDLAGFLVHLGEVINPGETDHIKLGKKLSKQPPVAKFIYYRVDG